MLTIEYEGHFKKDFKRARKRGLDLKKLEWVIGLLQMQKELPRELQDHPLQNSRNYKGMRECHIEPDWLLVYQIVEDKLILRLIRTGTHSDLF